MDLFERLPGALLPWYEENRRVLPWRQDREPYHIWISEIMLQQTRVEAVKGYYRRFLEALPDVAALADCPEERLNKLWEGLGYYSRVRNLKKAAQVIRDQYGGAFPREYDLVLALPGIGPYTAGAIVSIAFDLPEPAVDGNVLRLAARLTDDPTPVDAPAFRQSVRDRLAAVYPAQAGAFTQALMELGATICGPDRPPRCPQCPCRDFCLGHLRGTAEALPVRASKREKRREELTVFVLSCDGRYALEKRSPKGLLAGQWQFPNVTGKLTHDAALKTVEEMGLKPKDILRQVERKHVFTHVIWEMRGVYVEVVEMGGAFEWRTAEQLRQETALPTAFRQFWEAEEDV